MKNRVPAKKKMPAPEEIIATFGEARVVRVEGKIELRGGPMSDRMEALEWMMVFLPESINETQIRTLPGNS